MLYICYVDESGHCGEKYNPEQPVEVLFGVMLDLTKLTKAHRQHNEIIKIFKDAGIHVSEFKANDLYRGQKQFDGFSPELRDRIFLFLLSWGADRKCRYIVSPIDSKKHFDLVAGENPIAQKFAYPFEVGAMNVTLAIHRYRKPKKNNKGRTFVVFDEQNKHDDKFMRLFEQSLEFTDTYTSYDVKKEGERLNQIIDVPLFSKSHLATITQLADLGAFITRKYIELTVYRFEEKYDGELGKITNWYQRLGERKIKHTALNPKANDPLCEYYHLIRPDGWSAKDWVVTQQ